MQAAVLGDGLHCAISGDSLDAIFRQVPKVEVALAVNDGNANWRRISSELDAFDELVVRQIGIIQPACRSCAIVLPTERVRAIFHPAIPPGDRSAHRKAGRQAPSSLIGFEAQDNDAKHASIRQIDMLAVEGDDVNLAMFLSIPAVERNDVDPRRFLDQGLRPFAPPGITLPPKSVTPALTIHSWSLSSTRVSLTLTKR